MAAYDVAPGFDFLITDMVTFDHLIMVVSVRLLHYAGTFFPFVISNFDGEVVCGGL